MIETSLIVNGVVMDIGEKLIPVTYSVNDFGEINSATGDYSTDFTVPATNTNKTALKFASDVNATTLVQYTMQDATIVRGAVESYGFVQITDFDRTKNEFRLAFFSGNAEWFNLAKDISIKDLDFSKFDHAYTIENIAAFANQNEGFCYPLIDYGFNTENPYDTIGLEELYPATFYEEIINSGFRKIGYKVNYDALKSDQRFKRCIIPYSGKGEPSHLLQFRNELLGEGAFSEAEALVFSPTIFPLPITTTKVSPNLLQSDTSYFFRVAGKLKVTISYSLGFDGAFSIIAQLNGVNVDGRNQFSSVVGNSVSVSIDFEVTGMLGDELKLIAFIEPSINPAASFDISGSVVFEFLSPIRENSTIQLGAFLPNITFADFMTLFTKQFNLLFQANQVDQTITLFRFVDVINNIGEAVDYTEKVDYGGQQKDNYERIVQSLAKDNIFTYTDGKDDEGLKLYEDENNEIYGAGSAKIKNSFLPKSRRYIELDFSPTIFKRTWSGQLTTPIIPIVVFEREEFRPKNTGLRCLLVAVETPISSFGELQSIKIVSPSNEANFETMTELPFSWFWKTPQNNELDNLNFSLAFGKPIQTLGNDRTLVDDYYQSFPNLFTRPVLVELDAFLSVVDINNLDFSKPVFIGRPYNSYFFLNRIVEFIGQEYPCGLELLKIA